MYKGRNTRVISTRVSCKQYDTIRLRADNKDLSVNDYVKWVLLRPHTKGQNNSNNKGVI